MLQCQSLPEKMTKTTNLLFAVCLMLCLNSVPVRSLLCAQCNQADPGCRSGNILPTPCEDGNRYCYVIHVYSYTRQGTFRGCSDREDVEGCSAVMINQREGTVCRTVCDWEGCNSSHRDVLALIIRNR